MSVKLSDLGLLTSDALLAGASKANTSGYAFTDLGTLGGTRSVAYAINNAGQVAGSANTTDDVATHAIVWNGTTATDLGTWGGNYNYYSEARAINDVGLVAGKAQNADGAYHAFLWNGTTATDLGTLGGTFSGAYAINNAGQMVGYSSLPGDAATHATLWNGTTMTNLNSLLDAGTVSAGWVLIEATGINDNGWIIGRANNTNSGADHAFLWNGATMTDLNNLLNAGTVSAGWVLSEAMGINDNGWIVGRAHNTNSGADHAFLMAPVPEP